MTTSTNYQRNISDIARFLTEMKNGGFLFAVVKHQGIIPEINETLKRLGKNSNKKIDLFYATLPIEHDLTYTAQVTRGAEKADALIFNNLDEFIVSKPEEYLLFKLNTSREALYALRTPILFWVHEHNLQNIHRQFADVYSQRAFANIYFDDIPETEAGDDLDQYFGEEYLDTKEYERIKLRINLLTHQLEDAKKSNYPPLRTANDIVISLIEAYIDIRVNEPAYELLKKYKSYFKNTLHNLLIQGSVYRYFRMYDEALSVYQQAANTYNDRKSYCSMAHILFLKRNYKAAKNIYEETIERFPNDVVAKNGLAGVLKQEGDYASARNIYEQTAKQFPNDVVTKNGLAGVLKEQGDYTSARNIYEHMVERFPNDIRAKTGLADVLKKQGDYTASRNIYEQMVEEFPRDSFVRIGLMDVLKKQGNYELAKKILLEGINLFPNSMKLNYRLAELYNELAEYEKSEKIYEKIYNLYPDNLIAKNMLGHHHKRIGKYDKALEVYEEVLSINPDNFEAKENKVKTLQLLQQ